MPAYLLAEKNKCLTAQCVYCGWKHAQNSTLEKQHQRECPKSHTFNKAHDSVTDVALNRLHPSINKEKLGERKNQAKTGYEDSQTRKDLLFESPSVNDTHLGEQQDATATEFIYFQEKGKKCLTVQCVCCGWERAKNPTREKQHLRECATGRATWRDNNAVAHVAHDITHAHFVQQRADTSDLSPTVRKARNDSSIVAGLKAAKILASEAISKASALTPPPNCITPKEIHALFCQPLPCPSTVVGYADGALASSNYDDEFKAAPRLIQSRMLNDEEKAAAIAGMRAEGIEVISVNGTDSEHDVSWSDSDVSESASYTLEPVSLVQNTRYNEEPDPRCWSDDQQDDRFYTFDLGAAKRRISARPGRNANVKARKNGTKPGKLLAISDWQSRIRKHGNLHRESDRNPGPQKTGTYIREVADRTRLTIPRGFDDQEIMRMEVQGTMQDFLGLPRQMKYDLIGAPRLVAARTLAFSDATGRERVPDKEKFPVGVGG